MIRIRTKLVAAFLAIAVFVGLMAIGVYVISLNVADSFDELSDHSVPQIDALEEMKMASVVIYSRAVEFTVEDNFDEFPEYLEEVQEAKDDFSDAYSRYGIAQVQGESMEPNRAILADWNTFVSDADKLIQLVRSGGASEATIDNAREELEESQEKFESTANQVLDAELAQNQVLKSRVDAMENSSLTLILAVLVASVIFSASLGLLVSHRISKPLTQLKDSVMAVAKGNYETKILKVSNDEFGDLATHLEKMKRELGEKDKMQKEFIMLASHELRTPIQPILGFAGLALKGQMQPKDALKGIQDEAVRLKRLADNILDVSRIESDKMTYKMEDVDIGNMIENIIQGFNSSIFPGVSLVAKLSNEGVRVKGDEVKLKQALSNIIANAIKFTYEGNITISCAKSENSETMKIRISDTGTGIPADVLPKLFGKFVTKDIDGRNKQGTGLGLFISRAIIEAHGGQISAANKEGGKGAVFTIHLPVAAQGFVERVPSNIPAVETGSKGARTE